MRILLTAVSLFALINGLYIYFLWDTHVINIWEMRFYLFYAWVIGALIAFGILRVYNAVVSNTLYLLKLRQEIRSFVTSAKNLERSTSSYAKVVTPLKVAIVKLTTAITLNKKR
jgi:hypothetical protein